MLVSKWVHGKMELLRRTLRKFSMGQLLLGLCLRVSQFCQSGSWKNVGSSIAQCKQTIGAGYGSAKNDIDAPVQCLVDEKLISASCSGYNLTLGLSLKNPPAITDIGASHAVCTRSGSEVNYQLKIMAIATCCPY